MYRLRHDFNSGSVSDGFGSASILCISLRSISPSFKGFLRNTTQEQAHKTGNTGVSQLLYQESAAFNSLLTDEYCNVYVIYEESRSRPLAGKEKVVTYSSQYHGHSMQLECRGSLPENNITRLSAIKVNHATYGWSGLL